MYHLPINHYIRKPQLLIDDCGIQGEKNAQIRIRRGLFLSVLTFSYNSSLIQNTMTNKIRVFVCSLRTSVLIHLANFNLPFTTMTIWNLFFNGKFLYKHIRLFSQNQILRVFYFLIYCGWQCSCSSYVLLSYILMVVQSTQWFMYFKSRYLGKTKAIAS